MIRSNKFRAFSLILFLSAFSFLVSFTAHAEDSSLIIGFADWLHDSGDDVSAEVEYLRYLFITGTSDARAISTLARIYRTRGDNEKLLSLSEKYSTLVDDRSVADDLSFLRGYSLLKLQRWQNFDDLLSSSPNLAGNGEADFALSLAGDIYRGKMSEAKTILLAHDGNTTDDLVASIKTELASYAPKNRAVAVGLSALIPGLGKAYAHQYGDAFVSFAITSTLVALTAYTAYSDGPHSWKPWVYGVSAGAFYSANLYGSSEAAVRYNETHEKSLKSKVDEILAQYPR